MPKKTPKGPIPVAPQTFEEINQEYANLAAQVGHKAMMVKNTESLISAAQDEIEKHLAMMVALRNQAEKLKPAPAKVSE